MSTVGLQIVCLLLDVQLNVAPFRSLEGLLSGHWICLLMGAVSGSAKIEVCRPTSGGMDGVLVE